MYYNGSWATESSPLGEGYFYSLASEHVRIFYNYLKFSYIYITYLDHIHSLLYPQLSLGLPTISSSQLHVLLIFTHSFILSTKSNKCCPFTHRLSSSKEEQGTYQQPHHQRKIVLPSNHQLPIFMLKFPSHEFSLKNYISICSCMLTQTCIYRFSAPGGKRHQILPLPSPA